jgi:hypothetical protein
MIREARMLPIKDLPRLQREQFHHDKRNHFDILCLSKSDRLKHYGLHFAKYVGRLARGSDEPKSVERTLTDTLLVVLSAANTLHQELGNEALPPLLLGNKIDPVYAFADAAGRFADACEKIDHLEEFIPIARQANRDLARWTLAFADDRQFALEPAIQVRRKELAARQFYIME